MRVDLAKFKLLYEALFEIDYTGAVPGICVPLDVASIRAATAKGAPFLPMVYQQNYAEPLDAKLAGIVSKLDQQVQSGEHPPAYRAQVLEALYGAIYQHGHNVTKVEARPQLKRFLAVVSNLYRSFIDASKRTNAGVTLVESTPPLALFQSISSGPFTIESDLMKQKVGVSIGVVSLPATYRDHPVIWAGLAHEVGGHDVVHADAGLLEEMVKKVQARLSPLAAPGAQTTAALNALIWSYWMDEAAADVYGILNMGPSFALNLAGFLSAYRARLRGQTHAGDPFVGIDAEVQPGDIMDDHPIDLLRLYVAIGAVEGLKGLSASKRNDYVASIEAVAKLVSIGVTEVGLHGSIKGAAKGPDTNMKLSDAVEAARKVGKMLATEKFAALNNHCIQDIETWDDSDEVAAQDVCARVLAGNSIVRTGDDAQLLAGVTLALLQKPELYDAATKLLNAALDDSFDQDPIWGSTLRGHAMMGGRVSALATAGKAAKVKAGKVAAKKAKKR
jgi:hypothetical protein